MFLLLGGHTNCSHRGHNNREGWGDDLERAFVTAQLTGVQGSSFIRYGRLLSAQRLQYYTAPNPRRGMHSMAVCTQGLCICSWSRRYLEPLVVEIVGVNKFMLISIC